MSRGQELWILANIVMWGGLAGWLITIWLRRMERLAALADLATTVTDGFIAARRPTVMPVEATPARYPCDDTTDAIGPYADDQRISIIGGDFIILTDRRHLSRISRHDLWRIYDTAGIQRCDQHWRNIAQALTDILGPVQPRATVVAPIRENEKV